MMVSQNDDLLLAWAEQNAWREGEGADRVYGRLTYFESERRWVITHLEPQVAIRIKRVFPRINVTQVGSYTFVDSDEQRTELEWFADRYPLSMTPEDRARLCEGRMRFEAVRRELEQVLLPTWQPSSVPGRLREGVVLRPNQARAVEISRRMGRLLVADDVGLGKTHASLAAIMDDRFLPAAIMVQPHIATQWQKDFIQPFTTLTSHVIQGTQPYPLPSVDAYIFKYSNAFGWVNVAETGRFRSIIFDECQELRHGRGTDKGNAADVFARNAVLRIGLSATPIYGYGGEIFNILDIIEPGILGTREEFIREWCTTNDEHKMIVKDAAALGAHLRDLNLLLREVGQGPPPNRLIHEVPFDSEAADADEQMARQLAIKVLEGRFTERGQAARELDMYLRRITGIAKARHVCAFVKILLEAKTPIILGGWHRDVYDIWLKELAPYNPKLYTGSETPREKDAVKRAFMSGETDCIIMSLRSGAGLDGLQHRCSTVVHGELDWSREVHKQLAGRLRPHARQDPINEIYIVADGGSDPLIAAVQGLKASQAFGIIDPKRGVQSVTSDDSRIKALAKMYLERTS